MTYSLSQQVGHEGRKIVTSAPAAMARVGVLVSDTDLQNEIDQYARLTPLRIALITATVSYCGLMASISSMLILSAIPEIAADFGTSNTVISLSNALYQLVTALGPIIWGPLSRGYGRSLVSISEYSVVVNCRA